MPPDSLPSQPTTSSGEILEQEAALLADCLQSPNTNTGDTFELPLQNGKMKIWRMATERSIPRLPNFGLVLISIEITNQDGTRIHISGHRYEHAQSGSTKGATYDVTSWNKEGRQIETPKVIAELALDILGMAYNYKPEKMSPYVWGTLVSGMNDTHSKIVKTLANGQGNGV